MTPSVPAPAGEAPDFKPCPFCGAAATEIHRDEEYDSLWARCTSCGAKVGPVWGDSPCVDEDTPAPRTMLLNAWNQRVASGAPGRDAPPQQDEVNKLALAIIGLLGEKELLGRAPTERETWTMLDGLLKIGVRLGASRGLPAAPPERIATEIIGRNNEALRARIAELEAALADFTEFFMGEDLEGPQYDSWVRARTALGEGRPE